MKSLIMLISKKCTLSNYFWEVCPILMREKQHKEISTSSTWLWHFDLGLYAGRNTFFYVANLEFSLLMSSPQRNIVWHSWNCRKSMQRESDTKRKVWIENNKLREKWNMCKDNKSIYYWHIHSTSYQNNFLYTIL